MIELSQRALFLRVKRALARNDQALRACWVYSRWSNDLGRYYVIDNRNCVVATHVDLRSWALELGVAN